MIVINARFLTQNMTGVQRYAYEICKRLPDKIGNKQVVFVKPHGEIKSEITNFENLLSFGKFSGQLWEQIDLPLYLRKNGNPLLINFVGIAPIFYKNKVMFLYDLAFKHHPEWFSFGFQKTYNLLIPISVRNSKAIITDSYYVKSDINKTYKIPNTKISVIYAAASKKFIYKNLPKEKFVLTVSSIDPRKNLKRVIEAFNLIKTEYKLVIVGSKNKTFANTDIPETFLNDNIIFTGYLTDTELVDLYNTSGVFIYASLFEGFGIPPLEAQSCGCACLVSNTTSLPEVYGDSVEYCDPHSVDNIKEKLSELINSEVKKKELEDKGFTNAIKYNWDKSLNQFIGILKGIV